MRAWMFIIIVCAFYVVWCLCMVAKSADEQMDEIMEKWKDEKKKGVDTIGADDQGKTDGIQEQQGGNIRT